MQRLTSRNNDVNVKNDCDTCLYHDYPHDTPPCDTCIVMHEETYVFPAYRKEEGGIQ